MPITKDDLVNTLKSLNRVELEEIIGSKLKPRSFSELRGIPLDDMLEDEKTVFMDGIFREKKLSISKEIDSLLKEFKKLSNRNKTQLNYISYNRDKIRLNEIRLRLRDLGVEIDINSNKGKKKKEKKRKKDSGYPDIL